MPSGGSCRVQNSSIIVFLDVLLMPTRALDDYCDELLYAFELGYVNRDLTGDRREPELVASARHVFRLAVHSYRLRQLRSLTSSSRRSFGVIWCSSRRVCAGWFPDHLTKCYDGLRGGFPPIRFLSRYLESC